jgi:hypothetical protein
MVRLPRLIRQQFLASDRQRGNLNDRVELSVLANIRNAPVMFGFADSILA